MTSFSFIETLYSVCTQDVIGGVLEDHIFHMYFFLFLLLCPYILNISLFPFFQWIQHECTTSIVFVLSTSRSKVPFPITFSVKNFMSIQKKILLANWTSHCPLPELVEVLTFCQVPCGIKGCQWQCSKTVVWNLEFQTMVLHLVFHLSWTISQNINKKNESSHQINIIDNLLNKSLIQRHNRLLYKKSTFEMFFNRLSILLCLDASAHLFSFLWSLYPFIQLKKTFVIPSVWVYYSLLL